MPEVEIELFLVFRVSDFFCSTSGQPRDGTGTSLQVPPVPSLHFSPFLSVYDSIALFFAHLIASPRPSPFSSLTPFPAAAAAVHALIASNGRLDDDAHPLREARECSQSVRQCGWWAIHKFHSLSLSLSLSRSVVLLRVVTLEHRQIWTGDGTPLSSSSFALALSPTRPPMGFGHTHAHCWHIYLARQGAFRG